MNQAEILNRAAKIQLLQKFLSDTQLFSLFNDLIDELVGRYRRQIDKDVTLRAPLLEAVNALYLLKELPINNLQELTSSQGANI